MRVGPVVIACAFLALACGGKSRHDGNDGGAGASSAAADNCAEAESAAPNPGGIAVHATEGRPVYGVTLHNRCSLTVWPAWGRGGGLDNTVIDTQVWVAMPPSTDRSVSTYGSVRDIGLWGRTGCRFDESGNGACETGDCGGFVCADRNFDFPDDATVYTLFHGFTGGYNVPVRIESEACGSRQCSTDLGACPDAWLLQNRCGTAIACRDVCAAQPECCVAAEPRCSDVTSDIAITFCP